MNHDELMNAVREEVAQAEQDRDRSARRREVAEDYFYGLLPAVPADDQNIGFADVVSTDVADAVESVLAEILPAFTQGPVVFAPLTMEDVSAAEAETKTVHHVITSRGGYMAINAACKDALLRQAGVIKASWEVKQVPVYETLAQAPMQALMAPLAQGGEVIEGVQAEDGTVSATIRTYRRVSQPVIEPIPVNEFLIARGASVLSLDEARFVAQQRTLPRSDLIALGMDPTVVEDLSEFDRARSFDGDDDESNDTPAHKAMDAIMAVDAYYRIDVDGDGIAELRRIITAGGTDGTDELLYNEPWREQPFSVGVPYLGIFTWQGVSLFDKLKSVQDVKTELLRDLLDASRRNSRQRVGAVERDANIDDLLTSVRGGVVRCVTPQGVFPLPDVQIPQALFSTLEYMDKVRRDKGGGAIDTAEQATLLAGDTAHGIERMMSAAEQVNAMVARNLAETLIMPLYRKVHALLREYQQEPLMVPGGSGWQAQSPQQWAPREDVVLSMGMSTGERGRRTAALMKLGEYQSQAMQQGLSGQLVGLPQVYRTLVDLGRLAGLESPEQYWIDPSSPEAQQAGQQQAQQAQQKEQEAQQLALMQYQILPQVEKIKGENSAQIQSMKNEMDSMKAAMSHQTDMLNARIKMMDSATSGDQKKIDQLIALLNVEAKVDPMGAAEDIDSVEAKIDPMGIDVEGSDSAEGD